MIKIIQNLRLYSSADEAKDILMIDSKIGAIGRFEPKKFEGLPFALEVFDAEAKICIPGIIDPHEHLLGGSGEKGFSSQTPEIFFSELVLGGITTVVGCLGVDTSTKTMPGLLAKVKGLREQGLSAYLYSGGYGLPPVTLTGSIKKDLLYIEEVIGTGEIAISDERSTSPTAKELSQIVHESYIGGILTNKAGVTHFHTGPSDCRLKVIEELLEDSSIPPASLYVTHINRSKSLVEQACRLSKRGVHFDMDTVDEDLSDWLPIYLKNGGVAENLTFSSDAGIPSPQTLWRQVKDCIQKGLMSLAEMIPFITINPARILKLSSKGNLSVGSDADLVLLDPKTLDVKDVFARGRNLLKNGKLTYKEKFLMQSNREIELVGAKARGR